MIWFIAGLIVGAGLVLGFVAFAMVVAEENDRELRK